MRSLEEPDAPRGRGLWILLGLALVAAVVAWYAANRPASPPVPPATPGGRVPADRDPHFPQRRTGHDRTPSVEPGGLAPPPGKATRETALVPARAGTIRSRPCRP